MPLGVCRPMVFFSRPDNSIHPAALAAAAAFFLEWGLYDFVLTKIQQLDTLKLFVLTPFTDVIEIVAIAYALTGFLVGVFGSLLSIRKFLKV